MVHELNALRAQTNGTFPHKPLRHPRAFPSTHQMRKNHAGPLMLRIASYSSSLLPLLLHRRKAPLLCSLNGSLRAAPHSLVVLAAVLHVQGGGLGVGGRGAVGVCQQALYGGQDGGDAVAGRPLVLDDVQADVAIAAAAGTPLSSAAGKQRLLSCRPSVL